MGLRNFKDISKSFGIKLWWRFRIQDSVWAKFLMNKYVGNKHPNDMHLSRGSAIWRRMLKSKLAAEQNIFWIIGRGDINAVKDTWLTNLESHYDENILVKQLFSECRPKEDSIKEWFGQEAWKEIEVKNIKLTAGEDRIVWKATTNGTFTLHSAWELIRTRGISFQYTKFCWHNILPVKISIFCGD